MTAVAILMCGSFVIGIVADEVAPRFVPRDSRWFQVVSSALAVGGCIVWVLTFATVRFLLVNP